MEEQDKKVLNPGAIPLTFELAYGILDTTILPESWAFSDWRS